jgi:hypothetical protein
MDGKEGIRGILMKYEGKEMNKDLANEILAEIYSLFEEQDDCYYCNHCSKNLGNDCPDAYGCGDCCELGFYCKKCAKNQNFFCHCGKILE